MEYYNLNKLIKISVLDAEKSDRVVLEFEGDITKVVYCDNSDHADKFTKDILSKKFNSVLISPRNTILY